MEKAEIRFRALGTDIFLIIIFETKEECQRAREDLRTAKEIYFEKEKIFSRFNSNSELSRLNSQLGKSYIVSPDLKKVAENSLEYYQISQGLYDPRIISILETIGYSKSFKKNNFGTDKSIINSQEFVKTLAEDLIINNNRVTFKKRMDFSGLVKGYVTDLAAEHFKNKGWENFLIDSGGDIFASGLNENKEKWLVDLEGFSQNKLLIMISDEAVATSGITRRKWSQGEKKFHHLINPKNPEKFNFDIKSVTVISKTAEEADIWAKVLFLMGRERGLKFSNSQKIKSLLLDYRGKLLISKKIKENLVYL